LDIFSTGGIKNFLLTLLGTWLVILLVAFPVVRSLRQQSEEYAELNRAVDEQNKRREEAEERRRIYEENYQREGRTLRCVPR
jgi:flagellar biosynthesis/type III secretory pathway M-ring protein FliF/YscJ